MVVRRGKWHPLAVPMPRIIHLSRRSRLSRRSKVAAKVSRSPSASASLPSSSSSSVIGLRRVSRRSQAKASSDVVTTQERCHGIAGGPRGDERRGEGSFRALLLHLHVRQPLPFLPFLRTISHPFPTAVFAFSASWSTDNWILARDRGGPFRESKIDASLFPSLRNIGNDVATRVNGAFLHSFQRLLKDS